MPPLEQDAFPHHMDVEVPIESAAQQLGFPALVLQRLLESGGVDALKARSSSLTPRPSHVNLQQLQQLSDCLPSPSRSPRWLGLQSPLPHLWQSPTLGGEAQFVSPLVQPLSALMVRGEVLHAQPPSPPPLPLLAPRTRQQAYSRQAVSAVSPLLHQGFNARPFQRLGLQKTLWKTFADAVS